MNQPGGFSDTDLERVLEQLKQREVHRENKEWLMGDLLREDLEKRGWSINDLKESLWWYMRRFWVGRFFHAEVCTGNTLATWTSEMLVG